MARVALRQIFSRDSGAQALLSELTTALDARVSVEDLEGRVLYGSPSPPGSDDRFPVAHGETSLGWVAGPARARAVATLLEHLASIEGQRKALGSEVLHLYREINLMYAFSEKLAALLDVESVARLTLGEATHLIAATDAVVLLLDESTGALTPVAGIGDQLPAFTKFKRGQGIVGAVVQNGVGEIVNDVHADPRRVIAQTTIRGLVCAPMKIGERVVGAIVLGSTAPGTYTAAELKLLNTLALQTATAIENARLFQRAIDAARERERLLALHQEAELARAKLESEMKLAARIQANLFPSELPAPPGYELAARNVPARRCGGDYYDALLLPSDERGQLLACVADVSGKGLPAALLMSNMQATLRALVGRTDSLPVLTLVASELLYAATSPEKYVTAALAEISPASGEIRFVGAGHLDNAIVRADGEIVALSSTGAPLGLLPPGLPYGETYNRLAEGDALVLFSDGVTDAQNADSEEFGETRLHAVLQSLAGAPAAAIVSGVFDAIDRFVVHTPQFDDMTMLVVRRGPR